jgi:predicted secreted protein
MVHKKTRYVIFLLILVVSGRVYAGDAARFVNLGFSPDSRIFMFAQHGISPENGFPFAEIYTVDVPDNSFVQNGVFTDSFETPLSPGQDGSGALYNLLPDATDIIRRYRLDHLEQGRLIYLLVDGASVRDRIEFRDFESGNSYEIKLTQERRGSGDNVRAAFHLDITTRLSNGTVLDHRVGRPGYFREDIDRYRIKQVIVSPDERSLVAVIERIRDTASGHRIRYMVETVRIR